MYGFYVNIRKGVWNVEEKIGRKKDVGKEIKIDM